MSYCDWSVIFSKHIKLELDSQRCIQIPVKNLRWYVLPKLLTALSRYLFLQNAQSQKFDGVLNTPLLILAQIVIRRRQSHKSDAFHKLILTTTSPSPLKPKFSVKINFYEILQRFH